MQTVITDAGYEKTASLLKTEYASLSGSGSFFALVRTEYDAMGNVVHDFLDVIAAATAAGYDYVNTIVYPVAEAQRCAFTDNVKYVVWLCKNHAQMSFNKDAVREKHIWKDVEWGKRAKNYNPRGKDPGNVWIPTEDDGRAHITRHIMLGDEGVVERLLAMSGCGGDYVLCREERPPAELALPPAPPRRAVDKPRSRVVFRSSENMEEIADGSVQLAVTSPPYWNLKDYFKPGQIGQESYPDYLRRIRAVWAQCYRKLAAGGSLWININIRVQAGKVITIPHDFVEMCREIGFFYKGIVIWHKSSGIPTGEKNVVDHHEYVLVFSKSEAFSVDRGVFAQFADYKNELMNGGAFWNINRKAGSVGKKYIHPAIYPTELVSRIIRATTSPGGLVLDPFLGSGTTLIAAEQCGRACAGYEYNEGFEELMRSRFAAEIPGVEVDLLAP